MDNEKEFAKELKRAIDDIPMLVLNGMVILPGITLHVDLKEKEAYQAVNAAMENGSKIFAVMKNPQNSNAKSIFCSVGVIARVIQILKLPNGIFRVLICADSRAKLISHKIEDGIYIANIKRLQTKNGLSDTEEEAYLSCIKDLIQKCRDIKVIENNLAVVTALKSKNLDNIVYSAADVTNLPASLKQELLEDSELKIRAERLISILMKIVDIEDIKIDINKKLKNYVSENQREYVLREQIKVIKQELGEDNADTEGENYRIRLEEAAPPKEVREKLEKEIKRFTSLSYSSSESAVLRNYIETLLEYPWSVEGIDNDDLKKAIEKLEADHYGLTKIKERIVDYLAVRILSGRRDAPILCLVGPPGTGKTSIAKSVAAALHKEYGRIALGGVKDEAEIRGHRKTYIGAMPGRIVTAIKKTGVNNPLLLLDEIDKTSSNYKGDVSSALLEVLDGEQNAYFTDHYFEVPVDLSNVLFIATANDASEIPGPLRDRMEIIEVNSYTENEKYHIAKLYLIEKQLKKNGLTRRQFKITDEAIYKLIRCYTREAGVRNLERTISTLMQKTARGIVTGEFKSVTINPKRLTEMLGNEKYSEDKKLTDNQVGIVNGLAWTKVGGDMLKVEVNILDGKGGLTLTGNLGDVMKESAQIALSYIRTLPEIKKLPEEYFEKHIVHVHVPEGATPKDGPSAGITIALAIYSSLLNRPVLGSIAMTGEITLKGKVLPIGGLKEKLLAAKNAGMKKVIVPDENRKNVEELEEEITGGMEIIYVSEMSEVLAAGIVKRTFMLKQ